jgi:hypothetical protein
VSVGDPRLPADLTGACEQKGGEGSQFFVGLQEVFSTVWGLRPRVVYWLYTSINRPFITFASLVWWPGCQTASVENQLSRIQRLACLGITGAMRTGLTSAMEALTCLPALDLMVEDESSAAAHRIWSLG